MNQAKLRLGFKPRPVLRDLSYAASTIKLVFVRNNWQVPTPHSRRGTLRLKGLYRNQNAQACGGGLASNRVIKRQRVRSSLWRLVLAVFTCDFSIKQVVSTLARILEPVFISHETIYCTIYEVERCGMCKEMICLLRNYHKIFRAWARGKDRCGLFPQMTIIDERPIKPSEHTAMGRWKGPLIKGTCNRSEVRPLVERKTLFTNFIKMDHAMAAFALERFARVIAQVGSHIMRRLPNNQGREMSGHEMLGSKIGRTINFAHQYNPWPPVVHENTNGLLRNYFPKGSDLSLRNQDELYTLV